MRMRQTPKIGIYKITCSGDGKVYIGSAMHLRQRWGLHQSGLRTQKHHNPHLQFAWNKYGSDAFDFEIIEECEAENLIEREQYWIDYYKVTNREIGFNISPTAGSQLGHTVSPGSDPDRG